MAFLFGQKYLSKAAGGWGALAFVLVLIMAGVLIGGATASFAQKSKGTKSAKQNRSVSLDHIVDLTHTLGPDFPYFPIPGVTFPFRAVPVATFDKQGFAANRWEIHEHIGTQIDAPAHFIAGGLPVDQIPPSRLIAPLAVIDIRERAGRDPDTHVTVEDILAWERKHGRLPENSAVFMYSGWDAKVGDPKAFINADSAGLHFPGFSPEAVEFLAKERQVVGIGVDGLSLDRGQNKEFKAHGIWLRAGKWGVECVANLGQVPPAGATVFVSPAKVAGATGGPVRVIAAWGSE